MNKDAEQPESGASGKFHTVQPLRDLESNWSVDLAKNLQDYLLKICSGEITSSDQDVPHLSINFAEAALLLQGSVQVYSRKVEYLYSLVLHALEFISQKRQIPVIVEAPFTFFSLVFTLKVLLGECMKYAAYRAQVRRALLSTKCPFDVRETRIRKDVIHQKVDAQQPFTSQDQAPSGSSQPGEAGEHPPHNAENDSFWGLDDIPVESKNLLDVATCKDASVNLFVRPPANLVVFEGDCLDTSGDAGELESYLLATTDLYRDFLLLDPRDAAAVNDFLNRHNKAGKNHTSILRGSSLTSKSRKSFKSPTGCSGGTASKLSAGKNQDADAGQPAAANNDYEPMQCDGGFSPPAYDNGNGDHTFDMGDGYPDLMDSDDPDTVDPWKPLNPHEPGTLKVKPYKRVKANKKSRANPRKPHPVMVEFPLARLDGPISVEFTKAWEEKCASERHGKPKSPSHYEKLRESLAGRSSKDRDAFFNSGDAEDNGDSEDPENDPPDFGMPETVYGYEDIPHEDKDDGGNIHLDTDQTHEDDNDHANLEDLCRSHLDSLLASLAETEKQSEMASRVSTWKQRIEQNLEEQDSHPPFDIHEYGERVLSKLCKEGDNRDSVSFTNVVEGQEKQDVARTFSALLQLVNNGDVRLESDVLSTGETFCYSAENPFYVRLLTNKKPSNELPQSKKRAKSPKGFSKGGKHKLGKENHPVGNISPNVSTTCRFTMKLGKTVGIKRTPESKKRRKLRYVEPVNLHSPG